MQARQSSTCAQDAFPSCASAPVQHCAAWEVPAQPQQPCSSKELLLVTWQSTKTLEVVQITPSTGHFALFQGTRQYEQH